MVYGFDPDKPWSHRGGKPPSASSAQRGKRKRSTKMLKVYRYRSKRRGTRKNAPHKNLGLMVMECCGKACLQSITKEEILKHRRDIFSQNYDQQNYCLSRFISTELPYNGKKTKITYYLPEVGQVCKTAFKKSFGISDKKILYILKKRGQNTATLEKDLRGSHQNNARKLLPSTVDAVIRFMLSYNPMPSHYRRKTSGKKYFESRYTMRGIWRAFLEKNPGIKSNRLLRRNKGPALSFSCFRKIFLKELSHECSFRVSRVDTCQTCDSTSNHIKICEKEKNMSSSEIARKTKEREIQRLQTELSNHLSEAEKRYACFDYDKHILTEKRNKTL